jgi:hypothetical protein
VARPLRGHLHALRAGELDDLDHVLIVGRNRGQRRILPEGQVEGLCGGVPAVPARLDHGPLHLAAQCLQGGNRSDGASLSCCGMCGCQAHDSSSD